MKKIFISLIVILALVSNLMVCASELTSPNVEFEGPITTNEVSTSPSDEPTVTTAVPSASQTPLHTPTPAPTPKVTPSIDAPMTFTVTTSEGKTEIIQGEADNLHFNFKVLPKGTEDFTLNKIVNKDTGIEYKINKEISKNSSGWADSFLVSFNHTDVNKSVTFELQWTDFSGNSNRKTTASFKINVAVPQLSITTTPIGAIVPGAPITIKYHIQNTGNVTLKNVLLQDSTVAYLNSSVVFSTEEFLVPGAMFEREATVTLDGEATLAPSVTYSYKDNSYTTNGTPLTLTAQDVIPTITLECDSYVVSYKGASHRFSYTITNTSAVVLTDVYVYDSDASDAGVVNGPITIAIGETYTGTYEIPVYKSGYYKFKIHYSYEGADAEKIQYAKTDKALRLPNEVFIDIVRVTPETLAGPGEMIFTVLIENGTADDLRNVAIEEEYGLIERIELNTPISAAVGATPTQFQREIKVLIPEGTPVVQFNLYYTINGELSIINTSYDIIFTGDSTSAPEVTSKVTPIPTPQYKNEGHDDSKLDWWIWLLIFLLIFLIALIIILIFVKGRNNAQTADVYVKRKMANAFDDFDYDQYADLDDNELDALLDEAETAEILETTDSDFAVNGVTAAILSNDNNLPNNEMNEEFSTEFDDEIDDEGVKIFKSKK